MREHKEDSFFLLHGVWGLSLEAEFIGSLVHSHEQRFMLSVCRELSWSCWLEHPCMIDPSAPEMKLPLASDLSPTNVASSIPASLFPRIELDLLFSAFSLSPLGGELALFLVPMELIERMPPKVFTVRSQHFPPQHPHSLQGELGTGVWLRVQFTRFRTWTFKMEFVSAPSVPPEGQPSSSTWVWP